MKSGAFVLLAAGILAGPVAAQQVDLVGTWTGTWNDYAGLSNGGGTEVLAIASQSPSGAIAGHFDWVCFDAASCAQQTTGRENWTGALSGNAVTLIGDNYDYLGTVSADGQSIAGTWSLKNATVLGPWNVTRAASPTVATNYVYRMIDIPGATCVSAWGMNDRGDFIVVDCSGAGTAYLYSNGALTQLPDYPGTAPGSTFAEGISNSGELVGSYTDSSGTSHGFTYVPGTGIWTTVSSTLADGVTLSAATELRAIAPNAGETVGLGGHFLNDYGATMGFVYKAHRSVIDTNPNDVLQKFDGSSDPVYGALNSIAGPTTNTITEAMNDLGVVVGHFQFPTWYAFVYQGGSSIPTCPLFSGSVTVLPAGCTRRAYFFEVPGAERVFPKAITASGDIAGWYTDANFSATDGFIRTHSGKYLQVDATDPVTNTSYVGRTTVTAANALGQLAGFVSDPTQPLQAFNYSGIRAFIATPASASTPVPASTCTAANGGCDLSNGTIPHTITGLASVPGTVTEATCAVVPDPRIAQFGTCTGHTLPVAQVCPGFGNTVIPDYLCGGSGPANSGFVLAYTVAEGVDALSGILVNSEAYADQALGGTSPACPTTVGAWAPRTGSAVEGTIPEGNLLLEQTGACGSSRIVSRGLSIYGIGLTLNQDALPGTTPEAKLANFARSKYRGLTATVRAGSIASGEKNRLLECIASSREYFSERNYTCAAHRLVRCDARVAANANRYFGNASNPNVYGDIRGRLANLYLTIDSRISGNPPATAWPLPNGSPTPQCSDD